MRGTSWWGLAGQAVALLIILLVLLHWLGMQTQRLVDWWVERNARRAWLQGDVARWYRSRRRWRGTRSW